jgi:hypothetical protein
MLTGAPTAPRMPVTPSPRRRVWPWAAGSILITLAVIAATLVGHRLAAQHRLASEVAPAPALPPLAVQAIARAPGQITHMTLDTRTHTLVAQIIGCLSKPPTSPQTPQAVACGSADVNPVSGVAFFDSATGALRAQYLSPSSEPAQAIALTDATRGVTYLLANGGVSSYSDATGKQTNQYDSQLVAAAQAVALDDQTGLIYTVNGDSALNALVAIDGQPVASAPLPPPSGSGTLDPQLGIDASAGRVYVYNGNPMNSLIYGFNASDLTPLGNWRLSGRGGWLGPIDSTTHTLYLGASQVDLSALPADGASEQVNAVQTVQGAILGSASRFGFDHASGSVVVMNGAGVEAFAANATQPYAALPLVHAPTVLSADANPWLLPVNPTTGLAYLPGDDNTILIVSLAQPASHAAPNALTAEVIARAGMAALLPDTNQNPPFLSAQTFPVGAGQVSRQYFIHYSDLGWQGPYHGTASLGAVKAGATAGDYTMTFSVAWNQLFLRQHSWTVEVTPDGRTHLLADSGDAIP